MRRKTERERTGGGFSLLPMCCLALGLLFWTLPGAAQSYIVKGHLTCMSKLSAGDTGRLSAKDFTVDVSGGRYRIRSWKPGETLEYTEYVCIDGIMYTLYHLRPKAVFDGKVSRPPTDKDPVRYPAAVAERAIPQNDGSQGPIIWLGYASGAYFSALTNNMMPPVWGVEDPTMQRQPFDMAISFKTLSGAPHLPKAIAFLNDGFYRSYNPVGKSLDVVRLAAPYDNGFTNAIFQTNDPTNRGGMEIPTGFVFVQYTDPISPGRKPFERVRIQVVADQISDLSSAIEAPNFQGIADVADYRTHSVGLSKGKSSLVPPRP